MNAGSIPFADSDNNTMAGDGDGTGGEMGNEDAKGAVVVWQLCLNVVILSLGLAYFSTKLVRTLRSMAEVQASTLCGSSVRLIPRAWGDPNHQSWSSALLAARATYLVFHITTLVIEFEERGCRTCHFFTLWNYVQQLSYFALVVWLMWRHRSDGVNAGTGMAGKVALLLNELQAGSCMLVGIIFWGAIYRPEMFSHDRLEEFTTVAEHGVNMFAVAAEFFLNRTLFSFGHIPALFDFIFLYGTVCVLLQCLGIPSPYPFTDITNPWMAVYCTLLCVIQGAIFVLVGALAALKKKHLICQPGGSDGPGLDRDGLICDNATAIHSDDLEDRSTALRGSLL